MRLTFAALAATLVLAGCGGANHTSPAAPPTAAQPASATGSIHPPGWGEQGPSPTLGLELAPSEVATMFDSVDIGQIPRDPFADAGYTTGLFPTLEPLRRAWPQAHTISIAVSVGERAACADVEPGDLTPSQAPGWVRADERAGFRKPCLYSDWSAWTSELAPALRRAGIALASVLKWVASFVGRPQLLPGFDADQYDDHCLGRDLDCSLVLRSFLAAAQPPLAPPVPKPKPRPKPAPAPPAPCASTCRHAKQIAFLRALARKHGCYRKHHRKPHACAVWAQQVRSLS
jgi:hypothetical protein